MAVYIKNATPLTLYIAFAFPDSDRGCRADGFTVDYLKRGWYVVPLDGEAVVYTGWAGGVDPYFFYAHDAEHLYFWEGDYFTSVPRPRFESCWELGSSGDARDVGFRRIRVSAEIMDYTLRLTVG